VSCNQVRSDRISCAAAVADGFAHRIGALRPPSRPQRRTGEFVKHPWILLCLAAVLANATLDARAGESKAPAAEIAAAPASLDRDVPRWLEQNHVPSVSIAHIDQGKLVFAKAYGSQSPGKPATTKTLYNIASMTKPISAEVVLQLASTGRLGLDESMAPTWTDPDIANDDRRRLLTPRLALSHRSGFPNWRRQTGGILTFKNAPGEAIGYSGEGYEYVARFAQAKVHTDFEALAQKQIFDPLGMRDTAYTRRAWFEGRIAQPSDAQGRFLKPAIADRWLASDLLYTTPSDYAKFMLSVINAADVTPAVAGERDRVQASQKAEMCAGAKASSCPDDVGFGLGWEVYRFKDRTYLMHTGMDEGVFTLGYINLDSRRATILFTNGANGPKLVLPILDRLGQDMEFVEALRAQAG
jgi:CubicO group peptidase (beta-lactamase class C family)